jgi:hypothetical protein
MEKHTRSISMVDAAYTLNMVYADDTTRVLTALELSYFQHKMDIFKTHPEFYVTMAYTITIATGDIMKYMSKRIFPEGIDYLKGLLLDAGYIVSDVQHDETEFIDSDEELN